jgi:hypothetical protein
MKPSENQYNPEPLVPRAAIRRVSPVDGITPRIVYRSSPIRRPGEQSVGQRPPVQDRRGVVADAPLVASVPPVPVASSTPLTTPITAAEPLQLDNPAAPSDDNWLPTLAGPTPVSVAASTAIPPLDFTPPAKQPAPEPETVKPKRRIKLPQIAWSRLLRRQVLLPVGGVLILGLIVFGSYAFIQYMRTQASPDTIYKDALVHALSTKQLQITEQSSTTQAATLLDLTNSKSPRISTQTRTTIGGSSYSLSSYGSTANTYVSYSSLPPGVVNSTSRAVDSHWIQLRRNGTLPAGINAALVRAADPRYQAFGPLLFANLSPKVSQTIASYLVDHKVYGYKLAAVHSVSLGNKKALLYSGKIDADYLKIANQSVATSEGLSITDVQQVVDTLTAYKEGTSSLYVDPGKRLPLRLVLHTAAGQTVTYDYADYNSVNLSSQPVSNIDWPQFAGTQLQVEAQASAALSAAQRDSLRQAAIAIIQKNLTAYYARNAVYPSLTNLNDQVWLANNLPNFDPDTARDPNSSTLSFLAKSTAVMPTPDPKAKTKPIVTATPIYGYVYQPATAAGKTCNNEPGSPADQQCSQYSLSASLSSGSSFTVKNQ